MDKEHADKLADRLARITGERPDIVHSDAPDASARIARFSAGAAPWLVSVLMVSEGVDVPRLRVGVYATTRADRAVLPPGDRALHPPHAGAEGPDVRTSSSRRIRSSSGSRCRSRRSATTRWSSSPWARRSPSAASARRPASRSARCGRPRVATRTCCRRPRPGTRCSSSPSPTPAGAGGVHGRRRPRPAPAEPETAFERRERLRGERHALVATIARQTGEAHRRSTRASTAGRRGSVDKSTDEQLEQANRLLEREVKRRR